MFSLSEDKLSSPLWVGPSVAGCPRLLPHYRVSEFSLASICGIRLTGDFGLEVLTPEGPWGLLYFLTKLRCPPGTWARTSAGPRYLQGTIQSHLVLPDSWAEWGASTTSASPSMTVTVSSCRCEQMTIKSLISGTSAMADRPDKER